MQLANRKIERSGYMRNEKGNWRRRRENIKLRIEKEKSYSWKRLYPYTSAMNQVVRKTQTAKSNDEGVWKKMDKSRLKFKSKILI